MIILNVTKVEPTPKGKRSVRANIWGNTNAYVSGRFWKTLGKTYDPETEREANDFLNGKGE